MSGDKVLKGKWATVMITSIGIPIHGSSTAVTEYVASIDAEIQDVLYDGPSIIDAMNAFHVHKKGREFHTMRGDFGMVQTFKAF